jgi:large subunit ribosomal protein L17
MRHHHVQRTLGRDKKGRIALLRALSRSLIIKEGIVTTEAKAKELRPFVERLITLGKNGTLFARRSALVRLGNSVSATNKLFTTLGPRYASRQGGYTRIVRVGVNTRDGRVEARIEFV